MCSTVTITGDFYGLPGLSPLRSRSSVRPSDTRFGSEPLRHVRLSRLPAKDTNSNHFSH